MPAKRLMLQGTGSDVGKSMIAAGLCRALVRRGYTVRPFKPQNMSNNAAVTKDGGEIGRAQALQAMACGIETSVHMNPVLLKPQSDVGAQLVVQGKVLGNFKARDYQSKKPELMEAVLESFGKVCDGVDFVIVEGAGSPAEINLRKNDIANMGFAEAVAIPVVLIADIDRGGVIASLVGTSAVISDTERALVKGFIINKFRGDISLFDDGLGAITSRTAMASFGVLPFLADAAMLPQEDAVALQNVESVEKDGRIKIAVPRVAHISNFDDLDPLAAEADVIVDFIPPGTPLPSDADLILLPGSKATRADMEDFTRQGWDIDLKAHARRGGQVLGICGGYQMLGRSIDDPDGIEGEPGKSDGLCLLDVETILGGDKTLTAVTGELAAGNVSFSGYEMHMGATTGPDCGRPFLKINNRNEGAVSLDGLVMGCYVHGLFGEDKFRRTFLRRLRPVFSSDLDYGRHVDDCLNRIAHSIEKHLDVAALIAAAE